MIIIRKLPLLIFIIIFNLFYSQQEVLDRYPSGQFFYIGGQNALEIDMIKIVKSKGLLPCPNTDEKYFIKILVNSDSSIKYVKDFDSLNIKKNKCAFDFGRKIIPSLKHVVPAKENNKFIGAITTILIDPFFLYNSKSNPKLNELKELQFKKGVESFQKELRYIFEKRMKKNEDKRINITFAVNEKGLMEDFKVFGDFSDSEKNEIISELSRIKGEWTPITLNGVPRKAKLDQLITQQFNLEFESIRARSQSYEEESFRSR